VREPKYGLTFIKWNWICPCARN